MSGSQRTAKWRRERKQRWRSNTAVTIDAAQLRACFKRAGEAHDLCTPSHELCERLAAELMLCVDRKKNTAKLDSFVTARKSAVRFLKDLAPLHAEFVRIEDALENEPMSRILARSHLSALELADEHVRRLLDLHDVLDPFRRENVMIKVAEIADVGWGKGRFISDALGLRSPFCLFAQSVLRQLGINEALSTISVSLIKARTRLLELNVAVCLLISETIAAENSVTETALDDFAVSGPPSPWCQEKKDRTVPPTGAKSRTVASLAGEATATSGPAPCRIPKRPGQTLGS
jgi:hypothetical protein